VVTVGGGSWRSLRVVAAGARTDRCELAGLGFAAASWARHGCHFVAEPAAAGSASMRF